MESFANYVLQNGWHLTRKLTDHYDVLFTNHWMTSKSQILEAIRYNPRVRIVQRIDGAAQDYGRDAEADYRQAEVNRFADLTIFQSTYGRYATKEKYQVISQDGPVIYNPVDLDLFTPEGQREEFPWGKKVVSVTWSTNPLKGSKKIYAVAQENPNLDFVLCGNYPGAPRLPNLHLIGVLGRTDLAKVLRSCHVLLTFSENEACPNHVLEGLASGLPVLYYESGAMTELIADCGLPVTEDTFPGQFERVILNLSELKKRARRRALDNFNPDKIFDRYSTEIEKCIMRDTRNLLLARSVLAWVDPIGSKIKKFARTLL